MLLRPASSLATIGARSSFSGARLAHEFPLSFLVAAIIFPHTKWLKKITDYRDTPALIVALNGTELARWTYTTTQSQLFSLLCSQAPCIALHTSSIAAGQPCTADLPSRSACAPGSLRAPASEERTPSTCVSCRSTSARLHRSRSFCEQNCFSDFTNSCNMYNLFFFRSLSHSTLLSMSLRRVSPAERAGRPPCKSCVTVDMYPTVPWEYFFVPRFFPAFANNDNDLFSFSSLSPSIATFCSIL